MLVKEKIQNLLKTQYEEGIVNAGDVSKGFMYDGVQEQSGWHWTPFSQKPIFLGKSFVEVKETIENWMEA